MVAEQLERRYKAVLREDGIALYKRIGKVEGHPADIMYFTFRGVLIAKVEEYMGGRNLYVLLGAHDKELQEKVRALVTEFPGRLLMLREEDCAEI